MPKVALIQKYVPHYRRPLFQILSEDPDLDLHLLCDSHPGSEESGLDASLDELPVRPVQVQYWFDGRIVWFRGVLDHLRQENYDVVIFEIGWTIVSNILLALYCRTQGIKLIPWTKGIAEGGRERNVLYQWYERQFLKLCDAYLVYGNVSSKYLQRHGCSSEKIFVAQNTIHVTRILESLDEARDQARTLQSALGFDERPVIGYFGRMASHKDPVGLLRAYLAARKRGVDAQFLAAGSGPLSSKLQEVAARSPYEDDIAVMGKVPQGKEGGYFLSMDVFLGGRNAGLSVLEAMAYGRVIVLYPEHRPETELIEHEVNGVVSDSHTEEDLVDAICETLRHRQIKELGRKARQTVKSKATIEDMANSFKNAIQCVVNE
jgi:glycosyltransferase involved in cell wall biosynthesis